MCGVVNDFYCNACIFEIMNVYVLDIIIMYIFGINNKTNPFEVNFFKIKSLK